ncbi:phosphomannomutase [Copidosoma floridanum]|uniref:phosphomannomutase n=1 Tax=Copidosoma floridanum TaxID=29053 RepID=UPI0006C94878|nr:phosphomannomutase [Copidosoma floridanum]XP_014203876.1 phosphomannomutase [Copidosoma floridanum]
MSKKIICLFDVDGTLTMPQQCIDKSLDNYIQNTLRSKFDVAVVGGSDLSKLTRQLGEDVFTKYDYVFAENGLVAYRKEKKIWSKTILSEIGEEKLQDFINFSLHYISQLRLPFKRGNFIEFRTGMINISPVGRNCTIEERNQFYEYDAKHHVREKFIQALKKEFTHLHVTYSIGGQISFDVFPTGWDKTYCLKHVTGYNEIHFFGDKTREGGNDYEIYESDLTVGHRVTDPDDTLKQLETLIKFVDEKSIKQNNI